MGEMVLKDLRAENRARVFREIREARVISSPDLSKTLDLSRPTVTQNLKELLDSGVIYENGLDATNGGRRARTYSVVDNRYAAIGVDVTKNHITVVVVNLCAEIIYHKRIRRRFFWDEVFQREFGTLIREAVTETRLTAEQVLGVGVTLPALVTDDHQRVFYGNILGITGMEASYFAAEVPYPVLLFNDANAAGYAEISVRPELNDAFYISLSNNIGGSVLIDHKVYTGQDSHSGEIGHMTIYPDGKLCYCGQQGCFETCCNATVLDQYFDGNLEEFFKALQVGDAQCQRIWKQYINDLAIAVNNLRMLFDSPVILGGYVGAYLEPYMGELRQLALQRNPFDHNADYLLACRVKKDSLAFGSALHFVHHLWENI